MDHFTFSFESVAAKSCNYLERLVDERGIPYFNVFWTDPAEAAHDWPDFGDVMSRQLQGAVMMRRMTGRKASTEDIWLEHLLSNIDPSDGLLHGVNAAGSKSAPGWGDSALTLYALVTAYADSGDAKLGGIVADMAAGLLKMLGNSDIPEGWGAGFSLKPLVLCARLVDSGEALELAEFFIKRVFHEERVFTPDNTFRHGGHMHGNLRVLLGAADYALYVGDVELWSRIDAIYRWVKSVKTDFGFMPEQYGREGDIVPCETCALMDYAGLGVTLANHGHPEYWGDLERLARNHYVESQLTDTSWLTTDNSRPDSEQFTWKNIDERVVGAWAGWSSPNHILAQCETLDSLWGGPELKGKTRALQNCCGGSGVHGLYILWKNSARYIDGVLWVHMHLDKKLSEAEIRCFQPWQGLLSVNLKKPCDVKVRIPDFTDAESVSVSVNGAAVDPGVWGNYLEIGRRSVGDTIEVKYPLNTRTENVGIGNPGYRQYHYQVTWKGDTVVDMKPVGNEFSTGYSDFDKRDVPVFYGVEGPGTLYRREHMNADIMPKLSTLHEDAGLIDFWYGLHSKK